MSYIYAVINKKRQQKQLALLNSKKAGKKLYK